MKIHVIQHDDWVEPGEYLAWAERNGHEVSYTRVWKREALPQGTEDMLVVLGGFQCPDTTTEECEYFHAEDEMALIRRYAEAGRIVIGICLGAQLLGQALGAHYGKSPEREIGPVPARLTAEGRRDSFLRHFPEVFDAGEWHNDMPGLTEEAVILAESDGCPRQIVRYGNFLYGFQTHMEFTSGIIREGLEKSGGDLEKSGRYIQSREELLAYDYTEMNRLLSGFLDNIAEEYMKQRS